MFPVSPRDYGFSRCDRCHWLRFKRPYIFLDGVQDKGPGCAAVTPTPICASLIDLRP